MSFSQPMRIWFELYCTSEMLVKIWSSAASMWSGSGSMLPQEICVAGAHRSRMAAS
jgi:hypothetical protein